MIKILVVDDSKLARKRIIMTLSEANIEHEILAEASDGIEALSIFKELKPDLIITDLEMPNMDGLELIIEIRKEDLDVRIIVVSSAVNEKIKQTLKTDHHTNIVKKPIDKKVMEMLLLKIEHSINIKENL